MKYFEVHYRYKATHRGDFVLRIKAVDEKDARRLAHEKIDNRVFEVYNFIPSLPGNAGRK